MSTSNSIQTGNLAGKAQFFGSNTAETVSHLITGSGSWNEDRSYTVYSGEPWFAYSAPSNTGVQGGLFSPDADNGAFNGAMNSHRTILSGY